MSSLVIRFGMRLLDRGVWGTLGSVMGKESYSIEWDNGTTTEASYEFVQDAVARAVNLAAEDCNWPRVGQRVTDNPRDPKSWGTIIEQSGEQFKTRYDDGMLCLQLDRALMAKRARFAITNSELDPKSQKAEFKVGTRVFAGGNFDWWGTIVRFNEKTECIDIHWDNGPDVTWYSLETHRGDVVKWINAGNKNSASDPTRELRLNVRVCAPSKWGTIIAFDSANGFENKGRVKIQWYESSTEMCAASSVAEWVREAARRPLAADACVGDFVLAGNRWGVVASSPKNGEYLLIKWNDGKEGSSAVAVVNEWRQAAKDFTAGRQTEVDKIEKQPDAIDAMSETDLRTTLRAVVDALGIRPNISKEMIEEAMRMASQLETYKKEDAKSRQMLSRLSAERAASAIRPDVEVTFDDPTDW